MRLNEFEVIDAAGSTLNVDDKCIYGVPPKGEEKNYEVEIKAISDPDADYDDELGRGVQITPRVEVRFVESGETEILRSYNVTRITWNDYPDGPLFEVFQVDDLELIK